MPINKKYSCRNCGHRFNTEVMTESELQDAKWKNRHTYPIACPMCGRTDLEEKS